jgi:hypothetical protein
MVGSILVAVLLCLTTMVGLVSLLFLVFRMQVRAYNCVVASDRLKDWELQLERLDPAERDRARATPPAAVLDAMLDLPSRGRRAFFTGWNEAPVQAEGPGPDRSAPTGTDLPGQHS